MKEVVKNGSRKYPGANRIIYRDGTEIKLTETVSISDSLQLGEEFSFKFQIVNYSRLHCGSTSHEWRHFSTSSSTLITLFSYDGTQNTIGSTFHLCIESCTYFHHWRKSHKHICSPISSN